MSWWTTVLVDRQKGLNAVTLFHVGERRHQRSSIIFLAQASGTREGAISWPQPRFTVGSSQDGKARGFGASLSEVSCGSGWIVLGSRSLRGFPLPKEDHIATFE